MRLVPQDAQGFEKFVYLFVEFFVTGWFLVYQLSAWGILKNQYQRVVAEAGFGWHILGAVLFILAVATPVLAAKDKLLFLGEKQGTAVNVFAFILLVLSVPAYAGFVWNFKVW